ncbi:hypothetical protein AVEN_148941-1 [Araneus ventricosus]|uniref:Uncharacterized protein n=1 Tax=Araneus ventricosus TaxID=182803 RepID=A0A4Y2FN40_ARAVE|nr:hypothetical protein AVEN_148941-1 [Araneus ventricosus]
MVFPVPPSEDTTSTWIKIYCIRHGAYIRLVLDKPLATQNVGEAISGVQYIDSNCLVYAYLRLLEKFLRLPSAGGMCPHPNWYQCTSRLISVFAVFSLMACTTQIGRMHPGLRKRDLLHFKMQQYRYCPTATRKTLNRVASSGRVEERKEADIKSTAAFGKLRALR